MRVSFFSVICAISVVSRVALATQTPLIQHDHTGNTIPEELFLELEEHARLVDISYCVGMTGLGIQKPFECLSRCSEFENFELLRTWNTGPLLSDSCGYVALSHPPSSPRIIVAFRGTYSLTNTIVDLSTVPQQYVPYPGEDDGDISKGRPIIPPYLFDRLQSWKAGTPPSKPPKCENCTVHTGFYSSWLNTRREILPEIAKAVKDYPDYNLTLIGHSLGGAVAALAALDMKARGWDPRVTTFGEPRIGNRGLMKYIDKAFLLASNNAQTRMAGKFRRVTHVRDPIPLLPLEEWDYHMHSGELFIKKVDLPPKASDIQFCTGDEDPECIAGNGTAPVALSAYMADLMANQPSSVKEQETSRRNSPNPQGMFQASWPIPNRYRLWELFFAHRDYFWRLGLCVPGGDPKDWYRKYPHNSDGSEGEL